MYWAIVDSSGSFDLNYADKFIWTTVNVNDAPDGPLQWWCIIVGDVNKISKLQVLPFSGPLSSLLAEKKRTPSTNVSKIHLANSVRKSITLTANRHRC